MSVISGCATKSDVYSAAPLVLPQRYLSVHANDTSVPQDIQDSQLSAQTINVAMGEWWLLLQSPELNAVMDRVLANNPDLRIATLRMAQLQARTEVDGASRYPEVSVPITLKNESPTVIGGTSLAEKATLRNYQVGLRLDWRPDLWGEFSALYDAAKMNLLRAAFQREDMQRTTVANVVTNYLTYLSLNDRTRVAQETEIALGEMLSAIAKRLEIGDATAIDYEQQKAAIYQVRATIPVLQQQREAVLHRLASLAGAMPRNFQLSDKGLDSIHLPTGLPEAPLALLLRRPDVRAVEAQLLAADANIVLARARILPALDLTSQIGYGSKDFWHWLQPENIAWNFIANLSINLFDAGKRSKEVEFSRAMHEEMVETYMRVIYEGAREVGTAISGIKTTEQRAHLQRMSADAAQQAWHFSKEAYNAGAVDHMVLLDTERTYTSGLDNWIGARLENYQSLASLFSALGGGVPSPTEPTPAKLQTTANLPPIGSTEEMSSRFTDASIDWADDQWRESGEQWLVEIIGLYERSAIAPAWRDLQTRFPILIEERRLIRQVQGQILGEQRERASWYRLYLEHIHNRESAQQLCDGLQSKQQRCRITTVQEVSQPSLTR
jgi:NodT family efflux transporter outer membrane factor (OMF) lipoprotein